MRAIVLSLHPLDEGEKERLAAILRGGCHGKAIRAAFPSRFRSVDDVTRKDEPRIYFDSDAAYEKTVVEY